MKRLRLFVAPGEASSSLGELLCGRGGLTPDERRTALAAGGVQVNRQRVRSADAALKAGDEVVCILRERGAGPRGPQPLDGARILHLDDQVIAIDKPPGTAAQGTAMDASAGLDAAVRRLLQRRGERNPFVGLVHRLDIETSGVTLFGRTPAAVSALTRAFRESAVEKRYLALVAGLPDWDEREESGPIGADPSRPGVYTVTPRGRVARTRLFCRARVSGQGLAFARVEAAPQTGRTHQIRVHAAAVGHPLLGDRRYGGPAFLTSLSGERLTAPRVALHAASVACAHPSGGELRVSAPWPADLARFEADLARAAGRGEA